MGKLIVHQTGIEGCFLLESEVFRDNRGLFLESYHKAALEAAIGIKVEFVQDNVSVSYKGVLRGLHYQKEPYAQTKLVRVLQGAVLDVVVDLRKDSATYGQHIKQHLDAERGLALFIPKGTAHGFLALEDNTVFSYKCDAHYHPEAEAGIRYDDKTLGIDWGMDAKDLVVSERDLIW